MAGGKVSGRNGFSFVLLLVLGLILAACAGSGKDPFEKDGPGDPQPKGKTPPAVALFALRGMPPSIAADFRTVFAVSAGQRDIGIVEGDLIGGNFGIELTFDAQPDAGGSRITFQSTLRDEKRIAVDQASGEETAAGANGWEGVGADTLQRIADKLAIHLATKLAAMGYATRVSALIRPPGDTFALAGPNASKELDYETLNGPGAIDPAELANLPPPDAMVPVTEETGQQVAAAEVETPKQDVAENATVIRAVAVLAVKGAPGNGNAELTQAMRETLAKAGWPVLKSPRADALTVTGLVELAEPGGNSQSVKVSWVIKHPEGTTLGDVKQANAVPPGSLDLGFGEAALMVAEAAATGIFDLIKRYR
jgi:hypothetical protein